MINWGWKIQNLVRVCSPVGFKNLTLLCHPCINVRTENEMIWFNNNVYIYVCELFSNSFEIKSGFGFLSKYHNTKNMLYKNFIILALALFFFPRMIKLLCNPTQITDRTKASFYRLWKLNTLMENAKTNAKSTVKPRIAAVIAPRKSCLKP